jgi:hypothetical protein
MTDDHDPHVSEIASSQEKNLSKLTQRQFKAMTISLHRVARTMLEYVMGI